jgi:hypothetical protein
MGSDQTSWVSSGSMKHERILRGQYVDPSENPNGYCPNHRTGVTLPDDFAIPVSPLQYID